MDTYQDEIEKHRLINLDELGVPILELSVLGVSIDILVTGVSFVPLSINDLFPLSSSPSSMASPPFRRRHRRFPPPTVLHSFTTIVFPPGSLRLPLIDRAHSERSLPLCSANFFRVNRIVRNKL